MNWHDRYWDQAAVGHITVDRPIRAQLGQFGDFTPSGRVDSIRLFALAEPIGAKSPVADIGLLDLSVRIGAFPEVTTGSNFWKKRTLVGKVTYSRLWPVAVGRRSRRECQFHPKSGPPFIQRTPRFLGRHWEGRLGGIDRNGSQGCCLGLPLCRMFAATM